MCCAGVPTLHEEQLELGGDLRRPTGHSLAVEDALVVLSGLLQDEPLGWVVGHQGGVVGCDLLWRNLPVQGHPSLGVRHPAGHHGRLAGTQVDQLHVNG